MNTPRLKSGVLCSNNFFENDWKDNAEEGVRCLLKKHENFIALKMVEQISGAVVWFHLWYLEPIQNRFIENLSREGRTGADTKLTDRISVVRLESIQMAIKLLQPEVILIQSSLRFIELPEIS